MFFVRARSLSSDELGFIRLYLASPEGLNAPCALILVLHSSSQEITVAVDETEGGS